ncbi:peptidylprolyl isomerase [Halobacteriovorax sp. GB3]|uniref:peptidylprolyl isomerase n=1 Tax=Halobacteriovorax sp. GB3 TaxID=2719615 RepID=UPI00236004BC|nr:peptidylprolyl isomerase [Halobacteriovorax sp. GB3]MDD0854708.1 peptidylprolyl isomerase [Halobacteriovorax sp. GB3]
MIKRTSFLTLLVLFSLNSFAANDPVVASVNGQTIKKSELEKAYKENLLLVGPEKVTKGKVLKDLVNRILGIERAKNNKLMQDPVVKYKMEDVMYHAQVSKDLEPKLKKIVVTEKDIETYYKNHPEYRTAHILFRTRVQPEKVEDEEAMKMAFKIYDTLKKAPEKFPELANKYSQMAAAPNGGDIGYQPSINLAPEYFEAIKGKKVDYVSPPVKSQFGYHIIKILGVRKFQEINQQLYKKIVYDIKRDEILKSYFKDLRAKAKINIFKDRLK